MQSDNLLHRERDYTPIYTFESVVSILRSEYNDFSHHGHLSHITWKCIPKLTYNFNIKRLDHTEFHWVDEFGLSSLLRLSSPVFLLKQSPLQQVALFCVQSGFDTSKDRNSTNSLGSLLQCWITLTVKKSPDVTDFCSCLCPPGGYYWEISVSLYFPHCIFTVMDNILPEPSLLQVE